MKFYKSKSKDNTQGVHSQFKQDRNAKKLGNPSIGLLVAALNQLYKVK